MRHTFLLRCLAAVAFVLPASAAFANGTLDRGAYLAKIMDCGGCHTPGALAGAPEEDRYLGGSDIGFMMPGLGIFYPPNLTPDPTGLADWSVDDIIRAVREGVRPNGNPIAPIMPWPSYAALSDEDAMALATYLQSLPPVDHKAPATVEPDGAAVAPYLAPVMP